ncbi:DciA family protein [Niveibacterium microcysteis]|uniref:DUF721 domain-containing protein n=1 Tax=Niveibacterium microcysteis TaxID=2811415 RepID=A0ABX7M3U5_9RHOO|nr:DciA family protein [Niveibacterium microcysteis]QSI76094.1 DUF721 domain-containing protein [Niveibacterium microcysteis]
MSRPPRARLIGTLVGGDSPLARLQEHARQLVRLQRQLDLQLPDYLQGAVAVANLQNGVLALHVQNATVAARLKMLLPRLREGLAAQGAQIEEIRVRVRLQKSTDARRPQPVREIDADVLAGLEHLKEQLSERSPLAAPLARLIERAARRRS